MHWTERGDIWQSLDKVVKTSFPPLREFLDLMADHQHQLGGVGNALLFGGLGKFLAVYGKARQMDADGPTAYQVAMEEVYLDERIQALLVTAVNQTVDNFASNLEA